VEPLSDPYLFKKDPEYSDRTIRNRRAWYFLRLEKMLHCELSLPKAFECETASRPALPEQPVVLSSCLAQKTISLVSPKSASTQTKASASRSASFTTSASIPKLSQSVMLRSVASHPQPSVSFVPSATRSHMSPIPQASGYIPANSPTASRQTSQTSQPASFSSFASFGSGTLQPANQWISIQNPDPYSPPRKVTYQTELHLQDPAHDQVIIVQLHNFHGLGYLSTFVEYLSQEAYNRMGCFRRPHQDIDMYPTRQSLGPFGVC
jgi:hypothetical protein